jgi:hypothetical protein
MTAGHVAMLSPLARFEHNVIERIWISTSHARTGSRIRSSALVRKEGPWWALLSEVGAAGLEPTTSAV